MRCHLKTGTHLLTVNKCAELTRETLLFNLLCWDLFFIRAKGSCITSTKLWCPFKRGNSIPHRGQGKVGSGWEAVLRKERNCYTRKSAISRKVMRSESRRRSICENCRLITAEIEIPKEFGKYHYRPKIFRKWWCILERPNEAFEQLALHHPALPEAPLRDTN